MNGINTLTDNKVLFDTNIIIYYFNGIIDDKQIDKMLKESFNISIITKIEFLSWHKLLENKALKQKAKAFISHANVFALTNEIAEKVIDIRQQYRTKTPDAIIGATALTYGFNIVTNNINDFKNLNLEIFSCDTILST